MRHGNIRRVVRLACLLGGVLGPAWAHASSVCLPVHDPYVSARVVGLAGAGIALADGEEAIFVNPAGIGSLDDAKLALRGFSFPNATLGTNPSSLKLLEAYTQTGSSKMERIEAIMLQKGSDVLYARGSFFPTITLWRFQLGVLVDGEAQGYRIFTTPPSTTRLAQGRLEAWERSQAGLVMGFSLPYRNTGWSAGFTGRYMYRTSVFEDVDIVDGEVRRSSRSLLSGINHTKGAAADVGLLYRSARAWIPSFGATLRDVGDTLYAGTGRNDVAERERMSLGLGFAVSPWVKKKGSPGLVFTGEGHHLNDGRLETRDKIRFGGEFLMGESTSTSPFSVRVGHNLRGFSYGASVDAIFARIEAGSAVEPVPGSDGVRLDRRSFVRISVDLRH